jgi:DNA-binding response OmpR family regulator
MTRIVPSVVVIDDSTTAASLYALSAATLEVELQTFLSAEAAFDYLRDNQPDLVFLDIVMPDKDGLTLLKELRALPIHAQTPVVVATSKDYAQDRVVARELGVLEFLLKPLGSREIRALIRKYTAAEEKAAPPLAP